MSLKYALVARDTTVLADYTTQIGAYRTVMCGLLEKVPARTERVSFPYDGDLYSFLVDSGFGASQGSCWLCLACVLKDGWQDVRGGAAWGGLVFLGAVCERVWQKQGAGLVLGLCLCCRGAEYRRAAISSVASQGDVNVFACCVVVV